VTPYDPAVETGDRPPGRRRGRGGTLLAGLGLLVAVAALTQLAALWLLPRLIMDRAMAAVQGPAPPAPALPPLTDHTQRRIVMPSPDLAYATCAWDLSRGPLHVRADLGGLRYGSIALYARTSDNFFVLNDRQAAGRPVELLLLGPGAREDPSRLPAATRVRAPTTRGLLLMRVLIGDPATDTAAAEAARRSLRCDPLPAAGR
jgi:uncharacterized membrane protein